MRREDSGNNLEPEAGCPDGERRGAAENKMITKIMMRSAKYFAETALISNTVFAAHGMLVFVVASTGGASAMPTVSYTSS
jgi:hypothetical protein